MAKHTILCVDDEKDNVDALERLFRKKYRVQKAISGKEALEILKSDPEVSLIISDQRMPQMTGVEFLEKSMKYAPTAMRILLTGYTDIDSVIAAINMGQIYRYLTKPWDPIDLAKTVDTAIERYELQGELEQKNIQLQKALDELKTLDHAKSNFMLLINHELKTPLTIILSYLQMLMESNLNEEQKLSANRIEQASQRLQAIIHDSLELVSAETGVKEIQLKKVNAKDVIQSVTQKFEMAAKKKDIAIIEAPANAKFRADQNVVSSVLERLVENAVKFADEKSEIKLSVDDSDEGVRVSVVNKGKKTLSAKAISEILKPFHLDENALNHTSGTGLGLSVCQALLKTHDSELKIESEKPFFTASFQLPKA
ncbi:MAG: hybrid sensor histidine kinase/response regulator [Bdellovibrionales bacterium]|nr:hybrid sensor histidine kinase/response regulator [Bdellovibrionales bacterium]